MGSNADQKLLLNIKDIRQAASEKLSTTARGELIQAHWCDN